MRARAELASSQVNFRPSFQRLLGPSQLAAQKLARVARCSLLPAFRFHLLCHKVRIQLLPCSVNRSPKSLGARSMSTLPSPRNNSSISTLSLATSSGTFTTPSSPAFTNGEPLHRCLTRSSSLVSPSEILYTDKRVTLTFSHLTIRGLPNPLRREMTFPLEKVLSAQSLSAELARAAWWRRGRKSRKSGVEVLVKEWTGRVAFRVESEEAWWAAWVLASSAPKD